MPCRHLGSDRRAPTQPGVPEPRSRSRRHLFAFTHQEDRQMSRGLPSMTALLGLLAVAGYQNRDKIAEWLGGVGQQQSAPGSVLPPSTNQSGGLAGVLDQLRGSLAGSTPGGILSGGLAELLDRFKQNGQGETAESWVG